VNAHAKILKLQLEKLLEVWVETAVLKVLLLDSYGCDLIKTIWV
jgi:hypothetical protein